MAAANSSRPHAVRNANESEMMLFLSELVTINTFWSEMERIYKPIEMIIYSIGLAGNFLALITLWRSKKMTTTSFSYHRALVATDFIYCINFFANLAASRLLIVPCRENVYRYWLGAFFTGTLNPAVSSSCTYVLHYVTTVIALDRVLALFFATGYHKWNRFCVARLVIILAVVLSATVHSWSTFVQMEVVEYHKGESKDGQKHQLLISHPCWNESVVYYSLKRDNLSNTTKEALTMKDIYNGAWRMSYSVILTLLTLAVIAGLIRRRKRREAGRSNVSLISAASETSMVERKRKCSDDSSASRYSELVKKRKNRGCERMLFVLMIAVVLLAFFQVAASETSRIFQFVYPAEIETLLQMLMDGRTSMEEKLAHVRVAMYGHFYSRIFASAFTAIERSFVCILYMAMNAIFRRELLAMLKAVCFLKPCKICHRNCHLRIASKKQGVPETGATTIGQRDSVRLVVADVEPASGCHYRSVAMSRSCSRML